MRAICDTCGEGFRYENGRAIHPMTRQLLDQGWHGMSVELFYVSEDTSDERRLQREWRKVHGVPPKADAVECPDKTGLGYDGLEDVQCELDLNHPGDHQYTVTWPYREEWHGPRIPHPLHEELGRCDLMCKTMQFYTERIMESVLNEKPIFWKITNA